jgi:8-oxo-dGTP pyrophosphatase MutT (NUDIX family)
MMIAPMAVNSEPAHGNASKQSLSALRRALLPLDAIDRAAPPLPRAAVLIPLIEENDGLRIVYIRRAESPGIHSGQVAFPGGKRETTDPTLAAAALRESWEEVGIEPATVEMLGSFPAMQTATTGMLVAPFAGVIPADTQLRPAPAEVAEIFTVSIADLRDPALRALHELRRDGLVWKFPSIDCGGRPLWGLTYRITLALIAMLDGEPSPL